MHTACTKHSVHLPVQATLSGWSLHQSTHPKQCS